MKFTLKFYYCLSGKPSFVGYHGNIRNFFLPSCVFATWNKKTNLASLSETLAWGKLVEFGSLTAYSLSALYWQMHCIDTLFVFDWMQKLALPLHSPLHVDVRQIYMDDYSLSMLIHHHNGKMSPSQQTQREESTQILSMYWKAALTFKIWLILYLHNLVSQVLIACVFISPLPLKQVMSPYLTLGTSFLWG